MKTPEQWADELRERMRVDYGFYQKDLVAVLRQAMREAWAMGWHAHKMKPWTRCESPWEQKETDDGKE